jgi:hypothetical protein
MMHPENGRGPEPKPEASATATATATATSNSSTAIMDGPSTTRTCSDVCWCHAGSSTTWPYPHWQYKDTLHREIRLLEMSEGLLA